MSGLRSRRKGRRGEQQLAQLLRAVFPELAEGVRRGWQSREGDDDPDVIGLPGIWLESKCGKRPNPRAALTQARRDADGRAVPVAVIRDDRQRPFAVLDLADLLAILRAAYGLSAPLPKGAP